MFVLYGGLSPKIRGRVFLVTLLVFHLATGADKMGIFEKEKSLPGGRLEWALFCIVLVGYGRFC